jgi:hypothetical protein
MAFIAYKKVVSKSVVPLYGVVAYNTKLKSVEKRQCFYHRCLQ